MKTKNIFLYVLLLVGSFTFGQTYTMGTDTGTITTCSGTFYDSGGPNSLYGPNENNVITFCPDLATNPGSVISVEFTTIDIQDEGAGGACIDALTAYHGNSTAAPNNQSYCGQPGPFTIQSISPDGCITFEFVSDNTSQKIGWVAEINCYVPCTPPVAALVDDSTLDICSTNSLNPGNTTVSFDASPSSTVAGTTLASYEWVWGDGTIETTTTPTNTHTYPGEGVYQMSLAVRSDDTNDDPLGCLSPPVTKVIRVIPAPSYNGSGGIEVGSGNPAAITLDVDCGDNVDLVGIVTSQTSVQSTPLISGPPVNLPDGLGQVFNSPLDYSGLFPAGQTITPGCYPTLNFDIEHSYSGDLTIDLVAPSGEIVRVYNQEGNGIHFGTCANSSDDGVPGCTGSYSVADSGGVNWGAANIPASDADIVNCPPIYSGTCEGGNYYDATLYNSTNSFNVLDGAQMNGVWTLRITDNLNIDDGVLTSWSLDFPPSCYGALEYVTPDLSASNGGTPSGVWEHTGTGPVVPVFGSQTVTSTAVSNPGPDPCPAGQNCDGSQITNTITVGPFDTPSETYVYSFLVTDEFGCQYQQDVTINVLDNCTECTLNLSSATGTDSQNICDGDSIVDITYLSGNEVGDVTLASGAFPAGVTGSYDATTSTYTITGTPTATGTFNYELTTLACLNSEVATVQGTIIVTDVPVANALSDLRLCDSDGTVDTFTEFDFTGQTTAVLNGQTGMTVTYHTDPLDISGGTSLITLGAGNTYTNASNPQVIHAVVTNDANTSCIATTTFTLSTDVAPIANAPATPTMRLCDVGNDGTELYDLVTEFESEVLGTPAPANTVVTYYDSNGVLIPNPNAYPGTLASEVLTISVDNTDAASTCSPATTTVTIFLDVVPVANALSDLRLCDSDGTVDT
ncbi:MAG: proprotein convertase P-domain-containing protein, partial [Flavobacteriaceae bacterium]